ncbi:TetR/AcrR family transcriptional regulator [Nocardia sp. NPDC004711]
MSDADSPPPGGVRADARRSRARVLEAARATFATEGVAVSFNEIARSAGVGAATLYRHFPKREDLIAAAVGESLGEVTALAESLCAETDLEDVLRQWLVALVSHIRRVRGLSEEIARALETPGNPLAPHCEAAMVAAERLLSKAQRAGYARAGVAVDDLVRMATAIAWTGDRSADDASVDRLLDLVLCGVLTQPIARNNAEAVGSTETRDCGTRG